MHKHKTHFWYLALLLGVATFVATLAILPSREVSEEPSPPQTVGKVQVGEATLSIPSWTVFQRGGIWSLVSTKHSLPLSYTPDLVAAPVPHAAGNIRVSRSIERPLVGLVKQARADGVRLMISDGYRSAKEQKDVYASYEALYGQAYVEAYVAKPGASEHQAGLAVDFSSENADCIARSVSCSLDAASISWLRENAASYGFVERYPVGKQSITGVAGEHWHYRYVGVPLARALTAANMTLDEFVTQAAPGYAR